MGLNKLSIKSQATLQSTDIMPVQQDVGGTWTNFKTTLAKLREFIFANFLATTNTFTAKQTFNNGIALNAKKVENIAAGTAAGDAVNFGQLTNANPKTLYYWTGSAFAEATGLLYDPATKSLTIDGSAGEDSLILNNGFIKAATQFTPSGSADSKGAVGTIATDDNYIYVKTTVGWKRTGSLSTF